MATYICYEDLVNSSLTHLTFDFKLNCHLENFIYFCLSFFIFNIFNPISEGCMRKYGYS